jgi:glycosyltransferase involved in cell wall biosynthesis
MTEIVEGKFVTNELSKNAMGGTEQMALRMIRDIDPELLKKFQIIHSRPRELRTDLKKILVCHDLAGDDEVAQLADVNYRKQFDKIVFVSNWQAQMYNLQLGIPYSEFVVIPNAIEPFTADREARKPKSPDEPIRLIYHTTPHRGLVLLCHAYEEFTNRFPDFKVELDVYSSFDVYGWGERDTPYKPLFDHIKSLPGVTYHGFKPNSEVREALTKSDIFAYPCVWPETSCIAAIEALCSGNLMLYPNLAALPETVWMSDPVFQYQWTEKAQDHVNVFFTALTNLLFKMREHPEQVSEVAFRQMLVYNAEYNWYSRVKRWESLLNSLV